MLLNSYIHGKGTYDFLSCKRHHQLFAFLVNMLLQIKEYKSLYARKNVKNYKPHSEDLNVLFGALGTLGKYVKPVIFSKSLTLIISRLLTSCFCSLSLLT